MVKKYIVMDKEFPNRNGCFIRGDMNNEGIVERILIADSNNLSREKIKQIIADNYGFAITSEACGEYELMKELSRFTFDVLLLDTELKDGGGLNVLKKVKAMNPGLPVLVISMFPVKQYEESVFRGGAHGFVSKAQLSNDLVAALGRISRGGKYFSPHGIEGKKS